ncbi:MAG: ferredoxin [Cytophagaceae bacterium]
MSLFKKSDKSKSSPRYPENSQGDFYVQNQVCISCGAPEAEAPDLIEHSKHEYGHCYFKKQPKTEDEIERAINAIAVSCISGLRYGGKDEKILKRLYEIGEAEQCDHKPMGNYKMIVWTKVEFNYSGTLKELFDNITSQIILTHSHLENKILNQKINDSGYFEFTYRWTDGLTGTVYKCQFGPNGKYQIEIEKEEDGYLNSVRGNSIVLNLILCNDKKTSNILWYDMDGKTYDDKQIR